MSIGDAKSEAQLVSFMIGEACQDMENGTNREHDLETLERLLEHWWERKEVRTMYNGQMMLRRNNDAGTRETPRVIDVVMAFCETVNYQQRQSAARRAA